LSGCGGFDACNSFDMPHGCHLFRLDPFSRSKSLFSRNLIEQTLASQRGRGVRIDGMGVGSQVALEISQFLTAVGAIGYVSRYGGMLVTGQQLHGK
jgi:hypothetical protein